MCVCFSLKVNRMASWCFGQEWRTAPEQLGGVDGLLGSHVTQRSGTLHIRIVFFLITLPLSLVAWLETGFDSVSTHDT